MDFNYTCVLFIVSDEGQLTVVQQGMREDSGIARRYHWHSSSLQSFLEEPHIGICGENQGNILNMTDVKAGPARNGIMNIAHERPEKMLRQC